MAIGHVRYSTTGGSRRENAQPLTLNYVKGSLAVAHNGNLVNIDNLKRDYEYKGRHLPHDDGLRGPSPISSPRNACAPTASSRPSDGR